MSIQKYTFFPDKFDFKGSINFCRRFGGKFVDLSTSQKTNAVLNFLGKNIKENPKYDDTIFVSTLSPYTDEKENNVWIHYETGEFPIDPLPWSDDQPDGGMVECPKR